MLGTPSLHHLATRTSIDVYDQQLDNNNTLNTNTVLPPAILTGNNGGRNFRKYASPCLQLKLMQVWIQNIGYTEGETNKAEKSVCFLPICYRIVKELATKANDQTTINYLKDAKPAIERRCLWRLKEIVRPILLVQAKNDKETIGRDKKILESIKQELKTLPGTKPISETLDYQLIRVYEEEILKFEKENPDIQKTVNIQLKKLLNSTEKQTEFLNKEFIAELKQALTNKNHKLNTLESLLEAGVNPNAFLHEPRVKYGNVFMNALESAICQQNLPLTRLLSSYGFKVLQIFYIGRALLKYKNPEITKRLLKWMPVVVKDTTTNSSRSSTFVSYLQRALSEAQSLKSAANEKKSKFASELQNKAQKLRQRRLSSMQGIAERVHSSRSPSRDEMIQVLATMIICICLGIVIRNWKPYEGA